MNYSPGILNDAGVVFSLSHYCFIYQFFISSTKETAGERPLQIRTYLHPQYYLGNAYDQSGQLFQKVMLALNA